MNCHRCKEIDLSGAAGPRMLDSNPLSARSNKQHLIHVTLSTFTTSNHINPMAYIYTETPVVLLIIIIKRKEKNLSNAANLNKTLDLE